MKLCLLRQERLCLIGSPILTCYFQISLRQSSNMHIICRETTHFSLRYSSNAHRNFSAGALARPRVKVTRWDRDVAAVLRCLEVAFANMMPTDVFCFLLCAWVDVSWDGVIEFEMRSDGRESEGKAPQQLCDIFRSILGEWTQLLPLVLTLPAVS